MRESVPCAYRFVPSTPNAIVIADRIFRDLFFISLSFVYFAARDSDGCSTRPIQKRFEQLRRDPACFLGLAQAIFFFENSKLVQFNAAKQRPVNGGHYFCGRHGAAILGRELSYRAAEEFT